MKSGCPPLLVAIFILLTPIWEGEHIVSDPAHFKKYTYDKILCWTISLLFVNNDKTSRKNYIKFRCSPF